MSNVYERSKASILLWQKKNYEKNRQSNNEASRNYRARKKLWAEISADFRRILIADFL
jgi:hypothetical protein